MNSTMDYYSSLITGQSFQLLQELRRKFRFLLIGGWAVFLYTHALKSKDIDIVVEYDELEKLRKQFPLTKNERLKKYEVKKEEVDIDIYVPFYSQLGMPTEALQEYRVSREGFNVPTPEALFVLKLAAYNQRQGSPKGQKDAIDVISILQLPEFRVSLFLDILKRYQCEALGLLLVGLLKSSQEVPELGLREHAMSRLRRTLFKQLTP